MVCSNRIINTTYLELFTETYFYVISGHICTCNIGIRKYQNAHVNTQIPFISVPPRWWSIGHDAEAVS